LLANVAHSAAASSCCEETQASCADAQMICCQVLQTVLQSKIQVPTADWEFALTFLSLLSDEFLPLASEESRSQIRIGDPPCVSSPFLVDLERSHPAIAPPLLA